MEKLIISNTPHVKSSASTKRIMLDVMIALMPAVIVSVVYFGAFTMLNYLLCLASCFLSEVVYLLIRGEKFKDVLEKFDLSSLVTGLILGLNLPAGAAWYLPIFGGAFAIVVVKMLFGGTGKNFVNPAVAARVFLLISFAEEMTIVSIPKVGAINATSVTNGATVLGSILKGEYPISDLDLFLGTGVSSSAIGETCKLALIVGYVYLALRKVIDFKYPLIYVGVTGLTSVILGGSFSAFLPSILSGGLILGAVFMATDYVTTPNTTLGNIVYFAALGILTAVLRYLKGTEVVSYCILLMNFFVPLIDRFIVPKPFGFNKSVKEVKDER